MARLMALTPPLGPDDHTDGPDDAAFELVVYGDFQCPYCAAAQSMINRVRTQLDGRLRFAFRHFPLPAHPEAPLAAQASEAAHAQGAFWPMHDRLYQARGRLFEPDLVGYARELGLDVDRFTAELRDGRHQARVDRDTQSAHDSQISATPAFFANGEHHHGSFDVRSLLTAVGAS